MNKFMTTLAFYFLEVILSVERSHKAIFKGGIALLTVYLIGMSQVMPTFLDSEYEAKKLQYEFESVSERSLANVDCMDLKERQALCRLADYKKNALESTMNLAFSILHNIFWLGIFFIVLAVVGFLSKFESRVRSAGEPDDRAA